MSRAQLPGFMIVFILSLFYIKHNNVIVKFLLTIYILSRMLTISLLKHLNMPIKDHVKTAHKKLSLMTLTPIKILSYFHNLLKKTLPDSLDPLKFKPLIAPTKLLLKMQVFIIKRTQTFLELCSVHQTF